MLRKSRRRWWNQNATRLLIESLEPRLLLSALDLDPTFGTGGTVITDVNGGNNYANAVAVQSDGRIIIAGSTQRVGSFVTDFTLVRYNVDGSPDDGIAAHDSTPADKFGTDGKVVSDLSDVRDGSQATCMVIQPDGKILVGGFMWAQDERVPVPFQEFVVVRYNVNGTLDTTFGPNHNGISTTGFGDFENTQNSSINGLALQADGKIVAVGHDDGDFAMVRFSAAGIVESQVTTDFENGVDIANGVAIQGDGLIVVAGTTYPAGGAASAIAVARYEGTDLSLDTTFDVDGRVTANTIVFGVASSTWGTAVAVQPDGKIVVTGNTDLNQFGRSFPEIFRFNMDGGPDPSLAFNGGQAGHYIVYLSDAVGGDGELAMALQRNGIIDVAGYNYFGNFAAAQIDLRQFPSPWADGIEFSGGSSVASAIALAPDGNIVMAGYTSVGGSGDNFAIARLQGNPTASYATISGSVFTDLDKDGVKDTNEIGRVDARVYIDSNGDNAFQATEQSCLTDSKGNFKLDGLAAGTYKVRVAAGTSTQTLPAVNGSYTVTVTAGQNVTGKVFGVTVGSGSGIPILTTAIGGSVFDDLNANGGRDIVDPVEPDLTGVQVFLDLNSNGVWDSGEPTKVTDAGGNYFFGSLTTGTYRVRVVAPDSIWNPTTPTFYDVTVAFQQELLNNRFGMFEAAGDTSGGTDDHIVVRLDPADSTLLQVTANDVVTFDYSYAALQNININGGMGHDTIDIQDVPQGLTVTTIEGDSGTVNVGKDGALDGIVGTLNVTNPSGLTALDINDQAASAATAYTITSNTVTAVRSAFAASIMYTGVASLALDGGNNATTHNHIIVQGTAAGTPVAINLAGPGDDVQLDNTAGRLDDIHGLVTVNGLGANILNVYDGGFSNAGVAGHTYTVTSSTIARDGTALVAYSGVGESLGLTGGSGNDTYNIESLVPQDATGPKPFTLYTGGYVGGGNDTINLAPTAQNIDNLNTYLFLHGSTIGTTTLNVNDQLNPVASAWTITDTHVSRVPAAGGSSPAPAIVYDNINNLTVNAGSGNDVLTVGSTVTQRMILNGGAGNDTIVGGGGNEVILGGAGNDTLSAFAGRNLLIGGLGTDKLTGGSGDDILIGGTTAYDNNAVALAAIMAEWTRTDRSYQQRHGDLSAVTVGSLNGSYLLTKATVFGDGLANTLLGGAGSDWFFAKKKLDMTDQTGGEFTTQL